VGWRDSFGGLGPAEKEIVPQFRARQIFEDTGFEYDSDIVAGEHHYGMIMRKPKIGQ